MKILSTLVVLSVLSASLTACGESQGDRAISGGAIGAGAGAVGAAVLGGSAGTGALVGGALGAGTGALTNSHQVDLGKPVWRR